MYILLPKTNHRRGQLWCGQPDSSTLLRHHLCALGHLGDLACATHQQTSFSGWKHLQAWHALGAFLGIRCLCSHCRGSPLTCPMLTTGFKEAKMVWESAHIHFQSYPPKGFASKHSAKSSTQDTFHNSDRWERMYRVQLPANYCISPSFYALLLKPAHPISCSNNPDNIPHPPLETDGSPAY